MLDKLVLTADDINCVLETTEDERTVEEAKELNSTVDESDTTLELMIDDEGETV